MAMMLGIFKNGNGADAKAAPPPEAPVASDAAATQEAPAAPAQLTEAQKAALARQAGELRQRLHLAVGQIVLAMSVVPRYRHLALSDLQSFVLDPLLRDRIAIASAGPKDGGEGADAPKDAPMSAVAIWASVSDEVDAKIREQIKAGVFPIRLKPEEWTSGDKAWLLDVIAPSQKLASAVLANFSQVVKKGDVRIHPIVARMVDPELLKKMGAVKPTND